MKRMKATGPYYWDEVRQGTPQKVPLLGIGNEKEGQRLLLFSFVLIAQF